MKQEKGPSGKIRILVVDDDPRWFVRGLERAKGRAYEELVEWQWLASPGEMKEWLERVRSLMLVQDGRVMDFLPDALVVDYRLERIGSVTEREAGKWRAYSPLPGLREATNSGESPNAGGLPVGLAEPGGNMYGCLVGAMISATLGFHPFGVVTITAHNPTKEARVGRDRNGHVLSAAFVEWFVENLASGQLHGEGMQSVTTGQVVKAAAASLRESIERLHASGQVVFSYETWVQAVGGKAYDKEDFIEVVTPLGVRRYPLLGLFYDVYQDGGDWRKACQDWIRETTKPLLDDVAEALGKGGGSRMQESIRRGFELAARIRQALQDLGGKKWNEKDLETLENDMQGWMEGWESWNEMKEKKEKGRKKAGGDEGGQTSGARSGEEALGSGNDKAERKRGRKKTNRWEDGPLDIRLEEDDLARLVAACCVLPMWAWAALGDGTRDERERTALGALRYCLAPRPAVRGEEDDPEYWNESFWKKALGKILGVTFWQMGEEKRREKALAVLAENKMLSSIASMFGKEWVSRKVR